VQLRFLGTRGEIEARTRSHRRHSALLVGYRRREVMIDCGLDWRESLGRLRPKAIVLTHAHPDHAAGLRDGAPCPVYATEDTWRAIGRYPIAERVTVELRRPRLVVKRSIIRRRNGQAIGHASIRAQLEWCGRAGVRRAVFTHCGSEIVKGDARATAATVRALGLERGVEARIARDGLELAL
jgi:phosphoribosyl 1,2-cyclic phosphodiesterase